MNGRDETTQLRCANLGTTFVIISIASFLLYATSVLALRQDQSLGWGIEAQGALPVAISHLVYGTPLGAVDYNMLTKFYHPNGSSVQNIVAAAAAGLIPRGEVSMYSLDGIGAGSDLFATFAMWLFGMNILSLILFYLIFVGISVFAFVGRYRDERLAVVPLYFFAVTVMLATPISASLDGIYGTAIGGNRYFVLAAFLPALHIFFELIDGCEGSGFKERSSNAILLFIQGLLLFGALLVRSAAGYLLGALILALTFRLVHDRKQRTSLAPLAWKGAIVAAGLAFWATLVVVAMPAYVHSGRVLGNFWHRAFVSFSMSPEWPFGDLRKVYNCARKIPGREYIPRPLNRENWDSNGLCVWWVYPPNAARSEAAISHGLYGGEYERALRDAYFYVVTHYPKQILRLFFFFKTRQLKDTLAQAWQFLLQLGQAPVPKAILLAIAAQLVLFLFFVIRSGFASLSLVDRRMVVFPLFFLLSFAPRYVAWSSWETGADMIFLMYSCWILGTLFLIQWWIKTVSSSRVSRLIDHMMMRKEYR